jgi:predicted small secreted protein
MKKAIAVMLAVIVAMVLLTACGAMGNTMDRNGSDVSMAPSAPPMMSKAPAADAKYAEIDESTIFNPTSLNPEPRETMLARSAGGTGGGGDLAKNAGEAGGGGDLAEKIIYTAIAYIETIEFDETIKGVYELLELNGAFVENQYVGGRNYAQSYYKSQTYRTAEFTLRVPTNNLKTITESLDTLGNVLSQQSNAENITTKFYDTESRLNAYKVQEERLLAMLGKAETLADMLVIEERLANVRYEIESITSTLRNWQNHVDYSTLTLNIREVEKLTEITTAEKTYWEQIGEGLEGTTVGVGTFFTGLFKWIVISLPILAVLVVIAIVILIIVKVVHRRNRRLGKVRPNMGGIQNTYQPPQVPQAPPQGTSQAPPQASPPQEPPPQVPLQAPPQAAPQAPPPRSEDMDS